MRPAKTSSRAVLAPSRVSHPRPAGLDAGHALMDNASSPPLPSSGIARRVGRRAALIALAAALVLLLSVAQPARAQAPPSRGFSVFITGFDDVNGNGKLDCGEPVTLEVAYFDSPQSSTGAITGHITAPFAGSSGISFLHGTVQPDTTLTAGQCQGVITAGNGPSDAEADLDFQCKPPVANPPQGNAIAWTLKALFTGASPALTAVAHGTTSDGLDQRPSTSGAVPFGAVCTGAPATASLVKTAAGTGAPGSVLVYSIAITDSTGLGIGGVQLTDTVPNLTTFDAAASSAGWFCPSTTAGSLCTLPLGNVPPGGTLTRFFAVTLAAPLPAGANTIANTACSRQGPSLVLGCASASTPTTGAPVLKLAKTLQSGTAAPGATLVYQLALTNTGNQGSLPAVLQETVPANTAFDAAASSPGWTCAGTTAGSACTLLLAGVPAGGAATAAFAVTVADPLPAGVTTVTNTACLAGTQTCGSLAAPTTGASALAVHKTLSGTAAPGAALLYTVAVQNTGNQGAAAVTVTDQVPPLTTFQPTTSSPAWSCTPGVAAGSSCTATLPTLAAGATATLTFAVQVADPLPATAAAIANTACATLQAAPTVEAAVCDSVTTPTAGHPNLLLAKQYTGGPVLPGAVLTFDLQLSNTGNQDAAAITLQETVPAHTTFDPAASTAGWSCAATTPPSPCTLSLPGLAAGATAHATFAVTADPTLPPAVVIDNAACATTAIGAAGPTACANTSTPPELATQTTLAVTPRAVSILNGVATPAGPLAYTLVVPNPTSQTLHALLTTVTHDPHETLLPGSVSTDHGTVTSGNAPGDTTVAVQIGDLPPGQTATITFRCTLDPSLPPGTTVLSAQAQTTGANIPPDASDDPATPEPGDPTTTRVTVALAAAAIPTLGTWGLLLLCTSLALAALAFQRRRGGHLPGLPPASPTAHTPPSTPTPRPDSPRRTDSPDPAGSQASHPSAHADSDANPTTPPSTADATSPRSYPPRHAGARHPAAILSSRGNLNLADLLHVSSPYSAETTSPLTPSSPDSPPAGNTPASTPDATPPVTDPPRPLAS